MVKVVLKEWRKANNAEPEICVSFMAIMIIQFQTQWPGSVVPLTMFYIDLMQKIPKYMFCMLYRHCLLQRNVCRSCLISHLKTI